MTVLDNHNINLITHVKKEGNTVCCVQIQRVSNPAPQDDNMTSCCAMYTGLQVTPCPDYNWLAGCI